MDPEKPRLGGVAAIVVFIAVLLAFTIQSDLTTYIQTQLGFRQPYFLFYVAHSSFSFVFPLHILYLVATTDKSAREYLTELFTVIGYQFTIQTASSSKHAFPMARVITILFMMLLGLTGPGLLWYVSVSFTSISDVTALWNSNAFWAYVFTVMLYKMPWEKRKLLSVIIACFGVVAIVYGGATRPEEVPAVTESLKDPSAHGRKSPLLGNFLALLASIWYGLFQVIYKKAVALPNDPEVAHSAARRSSFSRLSISSNSILEEEDADVAAVEEQEQRLSVLPFGLHPNFLISVVGVLTAVIMAIPFPILHHLDIERFMLPPNLRTMLAIASLASMGLVFNSGFMILLGIWGPVITSVGGLLTIILVLFSDVLFVEGFGILTIWNLSGSLMIVGSFAILASEFKSGGTTA